MKVAAFIPARGGSKGIKGKNLAELAGKPLIQYTIDCAKHCSLISKVFVSSDDDEILRVSANLGAIPIKRPSEFSGDESPTKEAILHFIETSGQEFDLVALLQPTSPFRKPEQLSEVISLVTEGKHRTVISVSEYEVPPFRAYEIDQKGCLKGVFGEEWRYRRRQDYPQTFAANGAFYVFKTSDFLKYKDIPNQEVGAYIMDKASSLDIDTPLDLQFARFILSLGEEQ